MKLLLVASFFACLLAVAFSQTQNKNGNPTGEIGQPAFDEIIVESTLTVRGKSGSRSGKSLLSSSQQEQRQEGLAEALNGSSVILKRKKRIPRQRLKGFVIQNSGEFPGTFFGNTFPGSSTSSVQASSNGFNSNGLFGSFGASASQASSQSQIFGVSGFQGSADHSAAQTYYLPNGSKINVAFSNNFAINNGIPTGSNAHSFTITSSDGKIHTISG